MMKRLFLLLSLFLVVQTAEAATTVTRHVDKDCANNGDGTAATCASSAGAAGAYTTWANAVSDITSDYPNFVTSDVVIALQLHNGAADTSAVYVDGSTTDSTRYWDITCDDGYFLTTANTTASVRIGDQFVRITNCSIRDTSTGHAIKLETGAAGGNIRILRNELIDGVDGVNAVSVGNTTTVIVANNFFYSQSGAGINFDTTSTDSMKLVAYNNTIYTEGTSDNGIALNGGGTTDSVYAKDNVMSRCTGGACWTSTGTFSTLTTSKNITEDTSSPDGGSYQSKRCSYEDTAIGDLTLYYTDTNCKNAGDDLSADAQYAFSVDKQGNTRPSGGSWDIGADEDLKKVRYINTSSSSGGDGTTNGTSGSTRAYSSLSDAITNYGTKNLVTDNAVLFLVAEGTTVDNTGGVSFSNAYTTDATHRIVVYVPPAKRHEGVWDNTKYRIVDDQYFGVLKIDNCLDITFDGIQLENTNTSGRGNGIQIQSSGGTSCSLIVRNSILRRTVSYPSGSENSAIKNDTDENYNLYFIKNIVYGPWKDGIQIEPGTGKIGVAYNNTIIGATEYGLDVGLYPTGGAVLVVKNNLLQNNATDYFQGGANATLISATNMTKDSSSPDGASYQSKTVSFRNAAGSDYHLAYNDTLAQNAGSDLFYDQYYHVKRDVELQPIPAQGTPDIGADENLKKVRYINTDSTTGGDGTTNGTSGSTRAYATIDDALTNYANKDLIANNEQVDFILTGSTTADTSDVRPDLDGLITDRSHWAAFIVDSASRHSGVWSTSKFRLGPSAYFCSFMLGSAAIRLDGLQIENTRADDAGGIQASGVCASNGTIDYRSPIDWRIDNCIVRRTVTNVNVTGNGLDLWGYTGGLANDGDRIIARNNIIYGWKIGILIKGETNHANYIYNNTIINLDTNSGNGAIRQGGYGSGAYSYIKNNIMQCNGGPVCWGQDTSVTLVTGYNISEDATSPDTSFRSKAVTFNNEGSSDYTLSGSDTNALDSGTNLGSGVEWAFSTDIIGTTRPYNSVWDIGAHEYNGGGGGGGGGAAVAAVLQAVRSGGEQ